jgi:hypothetical protein
MADPSPILVGIPERWIMPTGLIAQKGAGSKGIRILRVTTTILIRLDALVFKNLREIIKGV